MTRRRATRILAAEALAFVVGVLTWERWVDSRPWPG